VRETTRAALNEGRGTWTIPNPRPAVARPPLLVGSGKTGRGSEHEENRGDGDVFWHERNSDSSNSEDGGRRDSNEDFYRNIDWRGDDDEDQ
jgi:hypothetical protein